MKTRVIDFRLPTIRKGQRFDTIYENGCVCVTESDSDGNFTAVDSDGIEASFHRSMIERVR